MINDGAIYHPDDNSYVFQDEQGRAHRESGPAHINNDYMEYRQHGNLHNLEGPAFIEFENKNLRRPQYVEYWIHGRFFSFDDWKVQVELERRK